MYGMHRTHFDHVRLDQTMFGPSIIRDLIKRFLTISHAKLTQSTALEQKRYDLRLLCLLHSITFGYY